MVINGYVKAPFYHSCVNGLYCSKYVFLSTRDLFGFEYSYSDAWCREGNDDLVYKFDTNSFDNNANLAGLMKSGILKPGMIVGFYYSDTQAPEFGKNVDCGTKTILVEYTHNALYLGKNDKGELIFAHMIGADQDIITVDGLTSKHFAARVVVKPKNINL